MARRSYGPKRASDPEQQLTRLAVRQCGVVRREQAYELGVPSRTLSRRVAQGKWQPGGRGVRVFPDSVLTGFSALAAEGKLDQDPWNVLTPEPTPWIRVGDHRRVRARVIRESTHASGRACSVPVALQNVTIGDLLRFLPPDDARTLLYRLAQRMGAAELARILDETTPLVARGPAWRQLRRLRADLDAGAHSDAEQTLVTMLRDSGFSGFVANYPVVVSGRRFRIDVAFPAGLLAIEVDGRAFHTDAKAFQHDRSRQNLLATAGWRVLRFTWADLTQRPEGVLSQIAALLAG